MNRNHTCLDSRGNWLFFSRFLLNYGNNPEKKEGEYEKYAAQGPGEPTEAHAKTEVKQNTPKRQTRHHAKNRNRQLGFLFFHGSVKEIVIVSESSRMIHDI